MKHVQKGSAASATIIIVVILIVIAGAYFVLHQQQESNADISAFNNQFSSSSVSTIANAGTSTSQLSSQNKQDVQINSMVTAMLAAYHNASSLQDVENIVSQYAVPAEVQQLQTAVGKMSSSSLAMFQTELLDVAHTLPNPASIQLTTTVNGDFATTTAILPTTVSTSTENYNNEQGGTLTTTSQNNITINLQNESGQWKVSQITVGANIIGKQSNNQ
jgi:hypothetical protein